MKALIAWLAGYWRAPRRPTAPFTPGFLTPRGLIPGICLPRGFQTPLGGTKTQTVLLFFHENGDHLVVELKDTIHYSNRSVVRATCPDCHVPHT